MKVVDPTDCLVSGVRELSGGGLLVSCKDTDAAERVQQQIEKNIQKYSKQKSDYKRMFRIVGMSNNMCNERLIECIKNKILYVMIRTLML